MTNKEQPNDIIKNGSTPQIVKSLSTALTSLKPDLTKIESLVEQIQPEHIDQYLIRSAMKQLLYLQGQKGHDKMTRICEILLEKAPEAVVQQSQHHDLPSCPNDKDAIEHENGSHYRVIKYPLVAKKINPDDGTQGFRGTSIKPNQITNRFTKLRIAKTREDSTNHR